MLLNIVDLSRRYAGLIAVDGLEMEVQAGCIHAVIGPNGAGKTTLFNMISGLVPPSNGFIHFGGRDVTGLLAHERAALGIARTFQNIRVFGAMTVLENVLTGLHSRVSISLPEAMLHIGRFRRQERMAVARARQALELVGLVTHAEERAAALSYGDKRRLEIARAIAAEPRLLLLDEPAAGMNPAETGALAVLVRRMRDFGMTVLLVEHDMSFVMDLSDVVTVMNFGRRIFQGTPTEVRREPVVVEAYLGPRMAERLTRRAS